jgi:putative transcriptional regulator
MPLENNFSNQFLIAMPQLDDPYFSQTVTYIAEHSEAGAMGITINRPIEVTLGEILDQMGIEPKDTSLMMKPVFMGGPVATNHGFVIHSPYSEWESTLKVNDDIGLTSSKDILSAIGASEGPDRIMVALGYSGWGEGQLEQEMINNSWLNCPADYDILFELDHEKRYEEAVKKLGIDLQNLSGDAGHA